MLCGLLNALFGPSRIVSVTKKGETKVNTYRKTAIAVGVLYIVGTVSGILSYVITGPFLNVPDYLERMPANGSLLTIGALLVLTMGVALALIPILIFPVSRKHSEVLAIGYVVFRGALETVGYIAFAVSWLLGLTLSQAFVQAGAPNASYFQVIGSLLVKSNIIGSFTTIVFILGALMFYFLLYGSKLVPRWISVWGLVAAIPYAAAGVFAILGTITSTSTVGSVLQLPLAVQEMVLAVWLIAKGFNIQAISAGGTKSMLDT
jgi:hypothetical protein